MSADEPPALPDPSGADLARSLVARARARAGRAPVRRTGRRTGRYPVGEGQGWSGPSPDARDPQPLGAVVERVVDESGWSQDVSVHGVLGRWDLVVGPEVAAHCRVESFAEGRLVVRAESTAWATQVRLLSGTLLSRLADEVGAGVVGEVVVLGPTAPSWSRGPRRVKGRGPRDTYG